MKFKLLTMLLLLLSLLLLILCACQDKLSGETQSGSTSETDAGAQKESESTSEERTESEAPPEPLPMLTGTMRELEGMYRISGRTQWTRDAQSGDPDGSGVTFNWSGSAIEFNAYCEGEVRLTVSSRGGINFRVYIDGEDTGVVTANAPDILSAGTPGRSSGETVRDTLVIAEHLERGDHSFRVVKMSRTADAVNLEEISLSGNLTPPREEKEIYIEFWGDSLMEGYGIYPELGEGIPYNDDTRFLTDDATRSFAYQTVMRLDADYSYLAISGMGMLWGYLPYNFRDAFGCTDILHDSGAPFDPGAARIPDLIVFSFGSNDANNPPLHIPSCYIDECWQEDVVYILEEVRAAYGTDIPLVFVCGISVVDFTDNLKTIAEVVDGVYICEMEHAYGGIGGHPCAGEADREADVLTGYLKQTFPDLFGE